MSVSVVVLTGAGISADSGVATFRGAGGLWEGHALEEVATPRAWKRDPHLVWRFYQQRRAQLAEVAPNAAHRALVELEARLAARAPHAAAFTLVTQNVDDLHERAGSRPLKLHGSLVHLRCERCGLVIEDRERLDPERFVPCGACGFERLRPDVVWFDEVPRGLEQLGAALHGCTHFVVVGTSGVVYPAAGLLAVARARGAATIVIGLEPPANLDPRDEFHRGRASELVPALVPGWVERWSAAHGEETSR